MAHRPTETQPSNRHSPLSITARARLGPMPYLRQRQPVAAQNSSGTQKASGGCGTTLAAHRRKENSHHCECCEKRGQSKAELLLSRRTAQAQDGTLPSTKANRSRVAGKIPAICHKRQMSGAHRCLYPYLYTTGCQFGAIWGNGWQRKPYKNIPRAGLARG